MVLFDCGFWVAYGYLWWVTLVVDLPDPGERVVTDLMESEEKCMAVRVLVDADACPVKDEVYKVASRYKVAVLVVSNSGMRVPRDPLVRQVIVSSDADAADDHIAELANAKSVVVTADIPLADRCLKAGALVIAPNGKPFTPNSIGSALATRALMADLRAGGDNVGGPPPFTRECRSRFLSALDNALVRLCRGP